MPKRAGWDETVCWGSTVSVTPAEAWPTGVVWATLQGSLPDPQGAKQPGGHSQSPLDSQGSWAGVLDLVAGALAHFSPRQQSHAACDSTARTSCAMDASRGSASPHWCDDKRACAHFLEAQGIAALGMASMNAVRMDIPFCIIGCRDKILCLPGPSAVRASSKYTLS